MRNLVLEHIHNQIADVKSAADTVANGLANEAKTVFELQMKFKEKELKELQTKLDESKDLTDSPHDEYPRRFVAFDLDRLIDTSSELERDSLKEFLSENYFADVDFEGYVHTSEGPCIVINDEGVVYDQESQKTLFTHKHYDTEEECFKLIEEHMEETGYFPSVVRYGRYGVIGYVNTQTKK